jgi:predicted permease
MLKRIKQGLLALTRRRKIERELDEELGYHLERATAQNIARGMSAQEARRAALVGFGGLDQHKEECRDARGTRLVEELAQDLRYGARVLGRSPGFVLVVVVMLGLGVGANTAIFSLVDKLLLRSLPVAQPDRLIEVSAESVNPKFLNTSFSYPDYKDYRDQNQVLDDMLAHTERTATLGVGDGSKEVQVSFVSSNYFPVLGISVRGRTFLPEEETAEGSAPVAILSYSLWASQGSDPAIIGKPITLNGATFTVVGVAAKPFTGVDLEYPVDLWAPLTAFQTISPGAISMSQRVPGWLAPIGRLKPGMDLVQAQTGLDTVAQNVFEANTPVSDRSLPFNEKHIVLTPAGKGSSVLRTQLGPALRLMTAVSALLLLIACANVAGLLLARAAVQRREVAIRLALGASRGRVVRMMLAQSGMLAILGAGAGLALAPWLHSVLLAFEPGLNLTGTAIERSLDLRVLAFTVSIAACCGLLFGLVPALQSSRTGLVPALKDAGQSISQGRSRVSLRSLLVVGQVALAMLILVGSTLLIRSLRNLLAIDPGFKAENVVISPVDLKSGMSDEAQTQFYNALTERLKGVPAISSVTTAQIVPLTGSVGIIFITMEGSAQAPEAQLGMDYNQVGPGYYQLMGIPIKKGRAFTESDGPGAPAAVVVNETFARTFYPDQDPIGKRISIGMKWKGVEIIGVAGDVKTSGLTEPPKPHIDLPALQWGYGQYARVLVRSTAEPAAVASAVRSVVKGLDASATTGAAKSMAEVEKDSIASARMASALTSLFGVVALLLAAIGLYGTMSYSVNQRSREIGIRMALGATSTRVLGLTLTRGAGLMTMGIALGLIGALATTRLIRGLLYGIAAGDLLSFVVASLLLAFVGLLACYVPARRAASGDPMSALRCE